MVRAGEGGRLAADFERLSVVALGWSELGDLNRSRFIVAPGQSGHPASRLRANFLSRWRDGETILLPADPAVIDVRITLTP